MHRVPGIVFVDSRTGKRPIIAGTGLGVWEVVATWEEINERLAIEESWTPERVRGELPFTVLGIGRGDTTR